MRASERATASTSSEVTFTPLEARISSSADLSNPPRDSALMPVTSAVKELYTIFNA
jgi:hypothetical protein